MNDCPDLSLLVDVEAATEFRALDIVHHVTRCDDCRGGLRDLEAVHDAMTQSEPAGDAEAAAIMAALRAERLSTVRTRRTPRTLGATIFALTFATALLAVVVVQAVLGPVPSPALALAVALAVGVAGTRHLAQDA